MVAGSDMVGSGRDRKAWRERPLGYPAFARNPVCLRLLVVRLWLLVSYERTW